MSANMTDIATPPHAVFRHTEHNLVSSMIQRHPEEVDHPSPTHGPEAMRELVRDYVSALHAAYLDHTRHLPAGERGRLPLVAAPRITVIAAATQSLHLLATSDDLPQPHGPEVQVFDDHLGVTWSLRFYDASVLPALGLLDDDPGAVRRALGVDDTIYHLTVDVGGGLGPHHAQHSGVALANQHARTSRDLEHLRHALPQHARLVDELAVCVRSGLPRASALLAAELTEHRVSLPPDTAALKALAAVLDDITR